MADVSIIWLGDEDPSAQEIEQFGYSFVKGEPVLVDDKTDAYASFKENPAFSTKKADPVKSEEPAPVDPDKGTEIAAVRAALDAAGIEYDGRNSLDTLRTKLAAGKE